MTLSAGFRIPPPTDETRWSFFENAGDAELLAEGASLAGETATVPWQDPRFQPRTNIFRHSGILIAQAETDEDDTATDAGSGNVEAQKKRAESLIGELGIHAIMGETDKSLAFFAEAYRAYPQPDYVLENAKFYEDNEQPAVAKFLYERYLEIPDIPWEKMTAARERIAAIDRGEVKDAYQKTRKKWIEADRLHNDEKYEAAAAKYLEVNSETSRPKLLYYAANALRLAGKDIDAAYYYRLFVFYSDAKDEEDSRASARRYIPILDIRTDLSLEKVTFLQPEVLAQKKPTENPLLVEAKKLVEQKKDKEALAKLADAHQFAPSVDIDLEAAKIFERQGEYNAALDLYGRALWAFGDGTSVLNKTDIWEAVARIISQPGMGNVIRSYSPDPQNHPAILLSLARAFERQGRLDRAREYYAAFLDAMPSDTPGHEKILEKLGRKRKEEPPPPEVKDTQKPQGRTIQLGRRRTGVVIKREGEGEKNEEKKDVPKPYMRHAPRLPAYYDVRHPLVIYAALSAFGRNENETARRLLRPYNEIASKTETNAKDFAAIMRLGKRGSVDEALQKLWDPKAVVHPLSFLATGKLLRAKKEYSTAAAFYRYYLKEVPMTSHRSELEKIIRDLEASAAKEKKTPPVVDATKKLRASPWTVAEDVPTTVQADTFYREARKLAKEGKHAEAFEAFSRAYATDAHPYYLLETARFFRYDVHNPHAAYYYFEHYRNQGNAHQVEAAFETVDIVEEVGGYDVLRKEPTSLFAWYDQHLDATGQRIPLNRVLHALNEGKYEEAFDHLDVMESVSYENMGRLRMAVPDSDEFKGNLHPAVAFLLARRADALKYYRLYLMLDPDSPIARAVKYRIFELERDAYITKQGAKTPPKYDPADYKDSYYAKKIEELITTDPAAIRWYVIAGFFFKSGNYGTVIDEFTNQLEFDSINTHLQFLLEEAKRLKAAAEGQKQQKSDDAPSGRRIRLGPSKSRLRIQRAGEEQQ